MNDNTTTEKTVPVEELLLAKPKRVYRTTKSAKQKVSPKHSKNVVRNSPPNLATNSF